MTLYRIDVQICGTGYVEAPSEADAKAKAEKFFTNHMFEVIPDVVDADAFVSDLPYDDERLPEVSISPAMTIHGVWPGAKLEEAEPND